MDLAAKLGALQERQFRLFFIGQSTSLLGDGMVPGALAFAVLDLTGSVSDLGFVLAARAVPMIVFLLVGGVFADRLSRRRRNVHRRRRADARQRDLGDNAPAA